MMILMEKTLMRLRYRVLKFGVEFERLDIRGGISEVGFQGWISEVGCKCILNALA